MVGKTEVIKLREKGEKIMASGDVWRVRINFQHTALGKYMSTGFYGIEQAGGAPTIANVGGDVKAWWDTGVTPPAQKTHHSASISLLEVTLQRVNPLSAVKESYTTGLPIAATGVGDEAAIQTAGCISLRTSKAGRRYRGRMYLPPFLESQVTENDAISVSEADNVRDKFKALRDALATHQFTMAVYHGRIKNPTPPPETIPATTPEANAVNAILVDKRMRTQRRRQVRTTLYESVSF